ncbi:coiled-coil domain-containing protein [Candidatus Jidaibacter acanthamoebae]|uniref:coiled-coil domain-containing protein n=1 Tax=Candidatus Jidaibacter acanthamoebae TaxID=86105 RepID=UPI0006A6A929|nr:coiled-coil domain-containing protein [Candidatus Jidaibacter acanthamoeba]
MTDIHLHAFDTHKYVKELQGTGFNESQAEVIVRSLLESREYNFSKLATRDQLTMLDNSMSNRFENIDKEIKRIEERFISEITTAKNEFKTEIFSVKNELKAEISNAQLTILKWIIPCFITTIGMIIGILIKLL